MTATNIFYNFVGFRYSPPFICAGNKYGVLRAWFICAGNKYGVLHAWFICAGNKYGVLHAWFIFLRGMFTFSSNNACGV